MTNTFERPSKTETSIKKVAILFAGGPAPGANAVISTAAVSFVRNDIEVLGIKHGYSSLIKYTEDKPLKEGEAYIKLDHKSLARTRNQAGILIGTARANPGKSIKSPADLSDPELSAPMKCVYDGLCSLEVDALISIGGDDTLKTANKFKMFQDLLPEGSKKIPVVHLPKTIDNDYMGIDFTFGYFTAVQFLSTEIRNLLYDAQATQSYYLAECMGRSAGWLAFGAAISGEASFVVSVEDITGEYLLSEEVHNPVSGEMESRDIMDMDKVIGRIVKIMIAREKEGKDFGVVVVAEGLAEYLPYRYLEGIPRDDHGHISIAQISLGKMFSKLIKEAYEKKTGNEKKVTGLQLGYEARCAQPHAFDVMLGSQLGVGAYRALVEEGHNGVMVSVVGQLDLQNVKFEKLVDPDTLVTKVRYIDTKSDFHRLARFLETDVNE
jgi:6-phosphofructokinase